MFRSEDLKREVYEIYAEIIGAWPENTSEKLIKTNYGQTNVVTIDGGHDKSLILIHGMFTNLCTWNSVIEFFYNKYNLVILDVPLEPGKSIPSRLYKKNSDGSKWLSSIIDELKLDNVDLVGVSLGGWIGLQYAKENPGNVNSLSIVSPHPIRGAVLYNRKPWLMAWYALLLAVLPREKFASKLLNELYDPVSTPSELEYKLIKTTIMASKMRQPPGVLSAKYLSNVSCPTFLIVGSSDSNFDIGKLDQCVKFMPNATYEIVEGAGHMLPLEKPVHVANQIDAFVSSLV